VRLNGSLAAAQELVRRWTQEMPEESTRVHSANVEDEDSEAPAPPLPRLKDWIEVEEQGGCRSVWGVPLGCLVDPPLGMPSGGPTHEEEGLTEELPRYEELALSRDGSEHERGAPRAPWRPTGSGRGSSAATVTSEATSRPTQHNGPEIPWPSLDVEAQAKGSTQPEDDADERARQEQLAATLRCMGFDEEPALSAALRAGGNLNVAVESMLQSRSSAGG